MTIRTRIHGFTAWTNMRLTPFQQSLSNVLMDLLTGTNMKYFLQSLTGQKNEKFTSFDNMSKEQLQTRIKWMLNELKAHNIVPNDVILDTRLFAVRSSKHVFDLLWRLVCNDIYFLWTRIDYLSNPDEEALTKIPFTWVPVQREDKKKLNPEISQLSGFGFIQDALKDEDDIEEEEVIDDSVKFPGSELMKSFSLRNLQVHQVPSPKACIIEMINIQLRTVVEGKKIVFTKLNELSDTRVLCGLINSFVPNLFPTEILMNDRWCINLVLRSIDKMLMCDSTMNSEDLVEAEPQSICAFFCYIFMMFYKFRQCRAVVNRFKNLEINIHKLEKSLDSEEVKVKITEHKIELENLKHKYDLKNYFKWIEKVQLVKESVHAVINNKFKLKYDWFPIEEDITVSNICYNQAINLSLTNGLSFYKLTTKESISRNRQIIVRQRKTGNFLNEFNEDVSSVIRKILKLPNFDPIEIDPKTFPNYDIFVECLSNNRILKKGTIFMYQVFPSSIKFYHNFLIKACVEKELDAVQRLVEFFTVYYPNFIDLKEQNFLNSALHICASNGYFKILLYLLENFANVNIQNKEGNTPLMVASESFYRDCAKLLIEFGADVNLVNNRTHTVMSLPTSIEYRVFLEANIKRLSDILPGVMKGSYQAIEQVIDEHVKGVFPLCTLRSRFINGSTLLHTCCFYGHYDLVEKLLKLNDLDDRPLSPNIRDYKGATPLHRVKDLKIMKLLIDYGADVNLVDLDGNMPLHVKCYGEKNEPSEREAIELLVYYRADLTAKNKKKLMPIHMAAMQGRLDVVKILVEKDIEKTMISILSKEQKISILTSPIYVALVNSQMECAEWMIQNGFNLKLGESNLLLQQILTQKVAVKNPFDVITFLSRQGCDFNTRYSEGNTALHYASVLTTEPNKVIDILIKHGAYVNVMNDSLQTPLFFAVKSNNIQAGAVLLDFDADYKCKDIDGNTAFDLIKEIDEWIKSDLFSPEIHLVLKTYEYKQTRMMIRKISEKIKSDFSSKAMLTRRKNKLNTYIHEHYQMINNQIITLEPKIVRNSLNNIYIKS